MPETEETNQKQPRLDLLGLDEICLCCEVLTKVLVQKGIITWDDLLAQAKTVTIERKQLKLQFKELSEAKNY